MYYINFISEYGTETIDQAETRKEANEICRQYNISDSNYSYYVSTRSTKEWRDSQ